MDSGVAEDFAFDAHHRRFERGFEHYKIDEGLGAFAGNCFADCSEVNR